MGNGAKLGLLGLLVTTGGLYVAVSNAYGGDKQAMMDGFHVLAERLGASAMPVFIFVHTVAIALCFPYAIVFEAAASFLFGFLRGVLCVFSAKVMGAALAFWLGRALFRNSDWASNVVKKNKYFNILCKGVARDGWKFVLLARFSPVPSYIINYGLAATDVGFFVDFLLPTIAGGLPMIIQNTSIGSLTSAATHLGADGTNHAKSGILPYVLPAIGILSSVMITWRIKKYATASEFGSGDDSSATTKEKIGGKDQGQLLLLVIEYSVLHVTNNNVEALPEIIKLLIIL
ncbi:hypothetical protein KC19_8G198800 [Ceratodon purpureus]|uniref:VTT domain-containing protein n=1 Tax=Ceratodon purpureus TaxID=3225 RepID=A0A8T0H2J0_CERPU|nr:hypothetical protein KC19_8G198800 [Ceratodon purpureus]